ENSGPTARTILFGRANQRAVGQIGRGAPRNSPFGRAQRDANNYYTGSGYSFDLWLMILYFNQKNK
ncbi:MAG: hypothetical protein Q7V48_05445, partial [Deltaproteobacteria bacterium]|nr:hypothetical protein [Deltaproteobacteria bacterium]